MGGYLFKFDTEQDYNQNLLSGNLDDKHTVSYITTTDTIKYDEENPISDYTLLYQGTVSRDSSIVKATGPVTINDTCSDVKILVGDTWYSGTIGVYTDGGGQAAYIDNGYYISPSIYKSFYRDKNTQSYSATGNYYQWWTNIPTTNTLVKIYIK